MDKETSIESLYEKMSLNSITLSFNKKQTHLEKNYREDFFLRSLMTNRLSIIFSIFAFSIFGILDAYLVPDLKLFFWILRYAIFVPVATILLLLTYFPRSQKLFHSFFLFLEILGGFLIIVMIVSAPPPVNYSYYAGLILVFMVVYTVSGMRFIWATAGSFIMVIFYEIAAVYFSNTPSSILINNNFFFIGANVIGMIACYEIERTDRRRFFLNYLLQMEKEKVREANSVLEEKVIERTIRLRKEIVIRTNAEQKLGSMLDEKEILLKELYHRTKNNMQIMSSMISLESSQIENPDLRAICIKTDLKIQSMAMVHEELYESKDLSRINFKSYIENIVPLIIDTYSNFQFPVSLNLELEDINIMIDSAIPCGLIISELILNIMKHAFIGRTRGSIDIKLSLLENEEIELVISDDGIGVNDNFNFRQQKSLGLETIYALGEYQLNGTVEMSGDRGVTFLLKFKDSNYKSRI